MPPLTPAQIAGVVKYGMENTGNFANAVTFPNPDTSGPVFVAIALVESSGIPDNVGGPNANGSYDYGLWQINGKAHPDLIKPGDNSWKIPQNNFDMAKQVYSQAGGKFTPWSTYTSGLYATEMVRATEAWQHPDLSAHTANAVTDTTNTVVDVATGVGDLIAALTKSSTWIRVGMGAAGVVLVLVVVAALMKSHLPGPLGAITRAAKASRAVPAAVTEGVPA
jgi:lysozyme-like protein